MLVITFRITTDRVKTRRMVNSYRTNVGNTCSPVRNNTRKFSRAKAVKDPPVVRVFRMEANNNLLP